MTVGLVLLMACGSGTSVPDEVIQPEDMVPLLVNLHQAEAKVANLRISKDSAYEVMRHYELYIYEQTGISEEAYLQSQQWYLEHPRLFNDIYKNVVDSLSYLEETVKTAPPQNEPEEATGTPLETDG